MRLFFAIELPEDVQATLAGLRPRDESRDYRWVDPAQLHLTLAFLGEQPDERVAMLRDIGGAAASSSSPGVLKLGSAGSFGTRRAPRVLWVDVSGDMYALLRLQSCLDTGLRQVGFDLEGRPFRPHVTLARRRETARRGPPEGWPPTISLNHAAFSMDTLTLFQSRLSPRGSTYVPLAQFTVGS